MDNVISARAEIMALKRQLEAIAAHTATIMNRCADNRHEQLALLYYDVGKHVLDAVREIEERAL